MNRRDYIFRNFDRHQEYTGQRVAQGVETHRKGDFTLEIVHGDGAPAADVKVKARLKNHAFLHGANCFMLDEMENREKNEAYKENFRRVFNEATIPFYWADLEPEQGKPRFAKDSPKVYRRPAPDLCLEYCQETGVTPKLHCLNYDQFTPLWVPENDLAEIKRLLEKRMREIGERYADKIPGIEVINEVLCPYYHLPTRHSTAFFWEDDLVEWSFETARKYFPKNELIINEATGDAWTTRQHQRSAYAAVVDKAIKNGAGIDTIGMQYHLFHSREDEERLSVPLLDPIRLYETMDFYWERFGKPLQVTEITIPAYSASAEDEKIQAELVDRLYSVWFSHPALEAAIYWNLVDGYAFNAVPGDMTAGENYFYGGLMRFDLSRKPAFDMLEELFRHRWHTEEALEADSKGCASFRGFYGDYEITLEKNGQCVKAEAALTKDQKHARLILAD